ncbi:MAG TPA: DUF1499 domain-containing protein [Nitrospirota bacterium]
MMSKRAIITMTTILFLCLFLGILNAGCSGVPPPNLGITGGHLGPCPATPNCVSSENADQGHAVEPLVYATSRAEAMSGLKKIILGMKRTKIVRENDDYLRVEFTSAVFRFVDDVEFRFDDTAKVIHLRSASRVGKSDFGVNRTRAEKIRSLWKALGK